MPKYYIQSGPNREIFDANDINHCIVKFIGRMIVKTNNNQVGKIGDVIAISEKGFGLNNEDFSIIFFDQALALYEYYFDTKDKGMY